MNNAPFRSPIADGTGFLGSDWQSWLTEAARVIIAATESGTERPQRFLWVGRRFFDTSLGKPIYVASLNPTVWKDAAGNSV